MMRGKRRDSQHELIEVQEQRKKWGRSGTPKHGKIPVLITRSNSRTEMTSIKTFNKTIARYRISSKILVHLFTTQFHRLFVGNNLTTKTLLVLRPHILHDEYVTFDENENDLAPSSTCKLVGSYFMASLGCDGLLKRYVVKIANR